MAKPQNDWPNRLTGQNGPKPEDLAASPVAKARSPSFLYHHTQYSVVNLNIETSQNVILEFEVAGAGDRIVASLLDYTIKFAYLLLAVYSLGTIGAWDQDGLTVQLTAYIAVLAPIGFYDLVMELLWNGQTIGKRVMNIKVIKIDGSLPGLGEYILRWTMRPIEILSNVGLIALVAILLSKYGQRLGDLAAGTTLIKLVKRDDIADTILEEVTIAYQPTYPEVQKLSDRDANIIKDTIRKAQADTETMKLLTKKIEEVLDIKADQPPKAFLDTVLKDFNYYTGKIRSSFDKVKNQ